MPKKKSLNDFVPDESADTEKRLETVEAHLTEIIKLLKKHSEQIETRGQQVDSLVNLYGIISDTIKAVEEKTYPGDIANAIREGFANLVEHRPTTPVEKQPTEQPVFRFDIFTVNWLQKNKAPAPANPNWGWAFAFTQDGGYHKETEKLVKYLERYGVYAVGDYIVKLGGKDNTLLQLNKKRS